MKRVKRTRKSGLSRLTKLQRVQLLHPFIASGIPAFESEEHRRRCWVENRAALMAAARAGTRPHGWWLYESLVPRDFSQRECEQLHELGLLTADELADLGVPAKFAGGFGDE